VGTVDDTPAAAAPGERTAQGCAQKLLETVFELGRELSLRDPFGAEVHSGFTVAQHHVLMWVSKLPGITMTGLARYLHTTTATATGVVDRLVRDGWLERERGDEDRRVVRLRLTERGRAEAERMLRRAHDRVATVLSLLSEHDRCSLVAIVERARAAVGARGPEQPSQEPGGAGARGEEGS